MRTLRHALLVMLAAGLPLASQAGPQAARPIAVSAASIGIATRGQFETWALATITNHGGNDALIAVESGDATSIVLRATTMTDAGAKMRSVLAVPVPAGSTLRLSTDGYYIAFIRIARDLKPGETLSATLHFSSGASLAVDFLVSETEVVQ